MASRRQIQRLVQSLVKNANDPNPKVKKTIEDSLVEIGKFECNLVLSECKEFLDVSKAQKEHRVALLTVILKVIQLKLDVVDDELGRGLVKLALDDMILEKNVVPEWQGKASSVMVALGMRYPQKIIGDLLALFGPGVVPHYFVMKTLADLAIANPVGTVPVLQDVFARMLPVLSSIKQENMRWVFANAVGSFCEAIIAYKANTDQVKIDVSTFAPQAYAAYELMYSNWLPSENKKIRLVTIQAIGSTCMVMDSGQLSANLPKLLPAYQNLYKKEKLLDYLPITQGLCNLLLVACQGDTANVLEPMRDSILNLLFPLICRPPDFTDSSQIKNHNEMLRCFEIVAKRWMDEILTYLFNKLESKETIQRNGTLIIMKHLVTRTQKQLDGKKELLVSALKGLTVNEKDLEVKKSMAQVIISMANENYLCLYGGESLIEFVIMNSSISDAEIKKWNEAQNQSKKKGAQDASPSVSPGEVRFMCDHILSLMTTTIPSMVDVLWPYLLEPLTKPRFTSAMAVVAKCLAHISQVKRTSNSPNYMIDFDKTANVNLPKPAQIIARLIVLAHLPFRRGSMAMYLLQTLQQLGPILHPNVAAMWDNTIPKLLSYLANLAASSATATEADVNKWEGLVRRLLTETIKIINNESFVIFVCDSIIEQMPLYEGDSEAKKLSYKTIGTILSMLTQKDYVKKILAKLFSIIDHNNEDERSGCAQAFGYCASAHLDLVLEQQLSEIKPASTEKKETKSSGGGGFFSSLFSSKKESSSSKQSGPSKGSKTMTLMLAYGYITALTKPSVVVPSLESGIIANMLPNLDTKDMSLQLTLVQAIDLISQSVLPERLQSDASNASIANYILSSRDAFLASLLDYMRLPPQEKKEDPKKDKKDKDKEKEKGALENVSDTTGTCTSLQNQVLNEQKLKLTILSLNSISTLLTLDPNISATHEVDLLNITVQYITSVAEAAQAAEKKEREVLPTIELLLANLDRVYLTLLSKDPSIACMKRIFNSLSIFFTSPDPVHRNRSTSIIVKLLKKYVELTSVKKPTDRQIEGMGSLVSKLIPRVCDPVPEVRGQSIESIQLLFYIQWRLAKIIEEGGKALADIDLKPPKVLSPLTGLRKKMQELEDQNEQFGLAHSMAGLLAKLILPQDLPSLILETIPGLVDAQLTSARGACVVIYGIVSVRGEDLKGHVIPIVKDLIDKIQYIVNEQTVNGTLHALKSIAKVHLVDSMQSILSQELPHKPHVIKVVQLIARDPELVLLVIKYLTDCLNKGDIVDVPLKEGGEKTTDQSLMTPNLLSQSCTVILGEMLVEEDLEEVVTKGYSLFFGTLLVRIGTTSGHTVPCEQLVTCWKNFFHLLQEEDITQKLEETGSWRHIVDKDRFSDGIINITSSVAKRHPNELRAIFKFMLPYLKASFFNQRTVVAYAMGELINHSSGDNELLDLLISHLLNAQSDPIIKIPALRGISNIVSCTPEQINKYAPTILDSYMSTLDSKQDDITLETMNGLAKLLQVIDESRITPVLSNICKRITPTFDSPNDKLRVSSGLLFASLSRFGESNAKTLTEIFHENLPSIVLHVNDKNEQVQKSFKKALKDVSTLLNDDKINTLLNTNHIFSVDCDIDYPDFVHHFVKLLINSFPERISNYVQICLKPYFESQWPEMKANAAYFVGCVLGNVPPNKRKEIGLLPTQYIKAIVDLLGDQNMIVRQRAAEACSMLYTY
eukprot:TRINITY_DN694_c5_g1_i1.p1 TRINITY_DN694_c5_g1~~TRINITY_DN694_c5_g1_i1.p1  ORF type:complete len:1709 (+),score=479.86 TRINITY_DN694_c5_g1_i1:28-5154(+)